jgi:hypothetical protein
MKKFLNHRVVSARYTAGLSSFTPIFLHSIQPTVRLFGVNLPAFNNLVDMPFTTDKLWGHWHGLVSTRMVVVWPMLAQHHHPAKRWQSYRLTLKNLASYI